MYKPQREGRSGGSKFGGKKFGGSRPSFGSREPWKRDDRGMDRPESFDATCASCGKDCRVPFRPNGRKPVYCSNCFVKDGESAPKRFGDSSFEKPSFRDRESRPSSTAGMDTRRIEEALRTVNLKLDTIMKLLNAKGKDEFDLG